LALTFNNDLKRAKGYFQIAANDKDAIGLL